jgi:hypothetical protein
MCEFSQRLVAWLDGELPEGEAAEMDRHLVECMQCRGQLDAYQKASDAFGAYGNAYGDAALSAKPGRISIGPTAAVSTAVAIAATVAAFFLFTARIRHSPIRTPAEIGSTTSTSQRLQTEQKEPASQLAMVAPPRAVPHPQKSQAADRMRRRGITDRQIEAPPPQKDTNSLPGAPAVEIAIPADAIFPPGAVPAGVSFTADVTLASDGSAEQIRLRPQLTEFERRGNQR